MARTREPFLWALFSAGGMAAALALPAIVLVLFIAMPLGWFAPLSREGLLSVAGCLPVRLGLLGLVVLSLFHWAHRFRFTLYDGLQLYHLNALIAALTYGLAATLSLVAAGVILVVV
jgi:succinate dehydrogenase subunit D